MHIQPTVHPLWFIVLITLFTNVDFVFGAQLFMIYSQFTPVHQRVRHYTNWRGIIGGQSFEDGGPGTLTKL